tara:strand:+ start:64 stop:672 length:609 start_codon:yes stop_codon:yes gene_type:complete
MTLKLRKSTKLSKVKELIHELEDIGQELGVNILHNYKWREMIQKDLMHEIGVKVEDVSGITGDDFKAKDVNKGDYKSTKVKLRKNGLFTKSGRFEFDKQNDPIRRQQVLNYDCLFFSWFKGAKAVASVLIKKPKAIKSFRKISNKKLSDFKKMMKLKEQQGKRIPRDSIQFSYDDVIAITGAQYFAGKKEITLKEFKELFGG